MSGAPRDTQIDGLFSSLYSDLRRLAHQRLVRNETITLLNTTALVHESYLKFLAAGRVNISDRAEFLAYAARVMRGLIIDDVRRRRSHKRGGLFSITSLGDDHADNVMNPNALILISDALDELAEIEPGLAEIIDLKFFCGFSFGEIAAMRGVSERTIQRNWEKGRLYLHHAIASTGPASSSANAALQR